MNKAFSIISVVIPTYNRSSLIGKSIESVFLRIILILRLLWWMMVQPMILKR
jgi:hypothetical protein